MRTVNLVQSMSRAGGGLFYSVRRLTESLADVPRMRVTVHSLRDEFSEADAPEWRKVRVQAHPVTGPARFGYAPGMLRGLIEDDADIVHCHGIWMYPSIAASRWRRSTGRPYMISPHGMLDPWAVRRSALKKRIARWLYEDGFQQRAACIRALCVAEAEAIRAYGLTNPVVVIPNGVDLPRDEDGPPPEWRSTLPAGCRTMLYLGRLHPKKNLENLIRAWASLRSVPDADGWRLLVAGWDQGGYESRLRALVSELALGEQVRFLGAVYGEAKQRTLRTADAMVLPSLSEGVPMAILEAWAFRMPAAITPHCNLPDGVRAGAAIEMGTDAASLARGLADFMRLGVQQRRQMGLAGRHLVETAYSWTTVAEQVVDCYRWILGGGQRPATLFEMPAK